MSNARFANPRWSPAKCSIVLYVSAALCDRELVPSEYTALMALLKRAPMLYELSDETLDLIVAEVIEFAANNRLNDAISRALDEMPFSLEQSLSIYANCFDIVRADQVVVPSEKRFMDLIAKRLKVPKQQRALIDRVMQAKSRY